jgi:hypothetical protein
LKNLINILFFIIGIFSNCFCFALEEKFIQAFSPPLNEREAKNFRVDSDKLQSKLVMVVDFNFRNLSCSKGTIFEIKKDKIVYVRSNDPSYNRLICVFKGLKIYDGEFDNSLKPRHITAVLEDVSPGVVESVTFGGEEKISHALKNNGLPSSDFYKLGNYSPNLGFVTLMYRSFIKFWGNIFNKGAKLSIQFNDNGDLVLMGFTPPKGQDLKYEGMNCADVEIKRNRVGSCFLSSDFKYKNFLFRKGFTIFSFGENQKQWMPEYVLIPGGSSFDGKVYQEPTYLKIDGNKVSSKFERASMEVHSD